MDILNLPFEILIIFYSHRLIIKFTLPCTINHIIKQASKQVSEVGKGRKKTSIIKKEYMLQYLSDTCLSYAS